MKIGGSYSLNTPMTTTSRGGSVPDPRKGDNVFVAGKKQPNGKIIHIDWYDREVIVECYDTHEHVVLEWDQFDSFNERLNQWQIGG